MKWGAGVPRIGKKVSHFLLLRREVVKVDACTGYPGYRSGQGTGRRVLDRARGAVLFFALCKTFLKTLADVVGNGGFLKPGLDVSQSFVGKSEFREEDTRRRIGGSIVTVAGKEIGKDIFFARKVLHLKVALREGFPPSTESAIM